MSESAECRGCGRKLNGSPYYMGGAAYDPVTRKQCKINFYGGFVCDARCDHRASLELEQTMPGHDSNQTRLGSIAQEHFNRNWSES